MPGAHQMHSMNAKGDTTVSSMDRQFMMHATQGNLAEVKTGQLALQKSKDASVRQVAQRLITDHTKAQQQLTSLAQSLHVTLPSAPSEEQRATYAKWSKLSGSAFDQSYLSGEMKDHAETIALFQKQVHSGSNARVRSWAQQTLPVLSDHAMQLKQAAQRQGNPMNSGRQSAASSSQSSSPMPNH